MQFSRTGGKDWSTEEANRELDESGKHAWLLSLKTVCKVSTASTEEQKLKCKNNAGFYLVSGFANAKKEQTPWEHFMLFSILSLESAVVMDTHFHKNSSQASFLSFLSDDLYVPTVNVNPGEKINR